MKEFQTKTFARHLTLANLVAFFEVSCINKPETKPRLCLLELEKVKIMLDHIHDKAWVTDSLLPKI
ncbi:hypothetical protein CS022_20160 [Veronia nyctiphanis]|uniref:Uncharacterized protein n=1 Tax=Veronia nyctiphanis TaxID=1278244 RepID=A0A4Q0YRT9_9GAMM|nr:hypothetical protein CS022_20160 [Veronia nyctiphanis]